MLKGAFARKGLSSQVIGPAILQSSPSMLCMLLVAVKVPLKKRVCPCDPPWVGLSSVSSRSARATDAESMIPAINIIKKRVCNFRFISMFPFKVDFDCSAQHPLGAAHKNRQCTEREHPHLFRYRAIPVCLLVYQGRLEGGNERPLPVFPKRTMGVGERKLISL